MLESRWTVPFSSLLVLICLGGCGPQPPPPILDSGPWSWWILGLLSLVAIFYVAKRLKEYDSTRNKDEVFQGGEAQKNSIQQRLNDIGIRVSDIEARLTELEKKDASRS